MNPVFIENDTISFTTDIADTYFDVVRMKVGLDFLMTPFGMIIPLDDQSLLVKEYMQNGPMMIYPSHVHTRCLLVTHTGTLLRVTLTNPRVAPKQRFETSNGSLVINANTNPEPTMTTLVLPYGKGTRYAVANTQRVQENAMAALEMCDDIPHAIDAFMKSSLFKNCKYITLNIPEIAEVLRNTIPRRGIPGQWYVCDAEQASVVDVDIKEG